jgi:hypothetical protein
MTHDKELLDVKYSFSPMSLEDADKSGNLQLNAERSARLEKNLEMVTAQDGEMCSPAPPEDDHEGFQSDQTESSALRNSTPHLWIFALMYSSPCM